MAGGFICPGNGHVWIFDNGASGADFLNGNTAIKLPGIVSWELTVDVEEATSIRTADTDGKKVKPCGDTTEYSLDLTCAIDPTDWIYTYILEDPGAGEALNPASTRECWMFATWDAMFKTDWGSNTEFQNAVSIIDCDVIGLTNSSDYQGIDNGVYIFGTFNPPGVGVDNDSSDATTSDFSFSISKGPFLPRSTAGLVSFPTGDEDITSYVYT